MSLLIRRILYIVFILAFFIITPVVVLYAAGYKLSGKGLYFEKTGILIIESKPSGARILLDYSGQNNIFNAILPKPSNYPSAPAKIKNLLPGEYNVKLELAGYWPWQKKLKILPGETTYATDLYLFKKNLPALITSAKINQFSLAPAKNALAGALNNQLMFIDLNNEEIKLITLPRRVNAPDGILWNVDGSKILIGDVAADLSSAEVIDLAKSLKSPASLFSWDSASGDKLYYRDESGVNYFNLSDNQHGVMIASRNIINYLVKDNYIYSLSNNNKSSNLNIYNLNDGKELTKIALPYSRGYKFINTYNKLLNVYDSEHAILYLIDPFFTYFYPLVETINNVREAHWVNGNRLFYANDFEIWYYDLTSRNKTLVTRISDKINSITWLPGNKYIVYATSLSINSVELDEKAKRNVNELIKGDELSSLILSERGDALYFFAKIGNREGLYKLAIQ